MITLYLFLYLVSGPLLISWLLVENNIQPETLTYKQRAFLALIAPHIFLLIGICICIDYIFKKLSVDPKGSE